MHTAVQGHRANTHSIVDCYYCFEFPSFLPYENVCVCVYVSVCACAREVRVVCCGLLWLVEVAHALLPQLFVSEFI